MMGGVLVWRKRRPFRICLPQPRITFGLIALSLLMKLWGGEVLMSVKPQQMVDPLVPHSMVLVWGKGCHSTLVIVL